MSVDDGLNYRSDSSYRSSASTSANEAFDTFNTSFPLIDKTDAGDSTTRAKLADSTPAPAAALSPHQLDNTSWHDPDLDNDRYEQEYFKSADRILQTRSDFLRDKDARSTNPFVLQENQLELGIRDGITHRLDNFANPDTRIEAIENTGIGFFGASGLSIGLTRLAKTAPELARGVGKVFKYAFMADVAYEVGSAAYTGFQTWKHPENYLQNADRVAGTLGSASFDYVTLGAASTAGYVVGELTFGLELLGPKLHRFALKTPVPKLEFDSFMGRPTPVAEPPDTPLADLFFRKRPSVVRVNNGSGVIVDAEEGLISTNTHVGAGRYSHYATTFAGQPLTLRPIAIDSGADLLIYKPVHPLSKPLSSAEIAPIESLLPGKKLFPIGHPGNSSLPYISEAVVKAEVPSTFSNAHGTRRIAVVEMKAPAVPGDSGSAIFDEQGRIAAQISTANAHMKDLYGPSSAHLSEMLRVIRENPSKTGWLDIKTKAEFTGEGSDRKLTMSSEFEVKSDNSFARSTIRKDSSYAILGSEYGLARIPGTAAIFSWIDKEAHHVPAKPK